MEEEKKQTKVNSLVGILLIILVIVLGVVVLPKVFNNRVTDPKEGEPSPVVVNKDGNDFYFQFLKIENKKENIVYSPLSIVYALKMLNEGAYGETKNQIEKLIGSINVQKYNNIENKLSLANSVYIRDTYSKQVKEEYINTVSKSYDAEIRYDEFKNATNINKWIEDKTFGQIKNMVKDEIVTNPNTKMFLINALAIDMEWISKFDNGKTHGRQFNLEDGSKMYATTMQQETKNDSVSYYKDDNVTVLSMDLEKYENEQLEFIAIMPTSNLTNYVNNFKVETLKNITSNLTPASKVKDGVVVNIPRFEFDYDLSLKDDLIKLGIVEAFDEVNADFRNMANTPLYVSDALHKANIEFTEKGVKAAAATVIVMTEKSSIMPETNPVEIIIDKPFMYVIRDKKTGTIWFVGTVYKPNDWETDSSKIRYE